MFNIQNIVHNQYNYNLPSCFRRNINDVLLGNDVPIINRYRMFGVYFRREHLKSPAVML